jgi:tripartite-type tricarboxylate transporter receptor subunit TctC
VGSGYRIYSPYYRSHHRLECGSPHLAERFKKVCEDQEFIHSLKDIGQPVMYLGPEDFGKYLKEGYKQFGKLIKEFNIKLE